MDRPTTSGSHCATTRGARAFPEGLAGDVALDPRPVRLVPGLGVHPGGRPGFGPESAADGGNAVGTGRGRRPRRLAAATGRPAERAGRAAERADLRRAAAASAAHAATGPRPERSRHDEVTRPGSGATATAVRK